MGKCEFCGKKIQYNKFIIGYKKVFHPECWDKYLGLKKEEAELLKPTPEAREAAEEQGIDLGESDESE